MIEEPEISLHPKAQIDVLEMFAEAIREDDKQIIATTHGIFMLQALGHAIQQEWLSPDQVAVWHVDKDKNGTRAEQLPINDKGFIDGWNHHLRRWNKNYFVRPSPLFGGLARLVAISPKRIVVNANWFLVDMCPVVLEELGQGSPTQEGEDQADPELYAIIQDGGHKIILTQAIQDKRSKKSMSTARSHSRQSCGCL